MRTYFIQFIVRVLKTKVCDTFYAYHFSRKVHKPDYQFERLEVNTQKIISVGFYLVENRISSPFISPQTILSFQHILRIEFGDIFGYCRNAKTGLIGNIGNDELPFLKNRVQNDISHKATQIAIVGCRHGGM